MTDTTARCTPRDAAVTADRATEAVDADDTDDADEVSLDAVPVEAAPVDVVPADGARLRVRVCPDGPVLVSGAAGVVTPDGTHVPTSRRTVAVCRCERSTRAPWCDGTHKLLPPGTLP
ncbi:CDGSH iron-sulfur domain-containing protein [Aquipuribacter sp. SD81]|uniref:CDGSH iron-sulfur domain-containing protein n=1 Tax=Aquipuribacter sp. SD81 TaxID=3127703 RepID=UPI00301908F1